MRCLDVDVEALVELPSGTDVFETFTGRKPCHPAVVDTHHIRCRRCDFTPIVRNENTRNYRPCARVGCCFAGEISGVEFRDGGVEVLEVENDNTRDSLLGVDLHDLEGIVLNRLGVTARHANSCEGEASPRVARMPNIVIVKPTPTVA